MLDGEKTCAGHGELGRDGDEEIPPDRGRTARSYEQSPTTIATRRPERQVPGLRYAFGGHPLAARGIGVGIRESERVITVGPVRIEHDRWPYLAAQVGEHLVDRLDGASGMKQVMMDAGKELLHYAPKKSAVDASDATTTHLGFALMGRSLERIGAGEPLAGAVARSFEQFREVEASSAALVFDVGWVPTTDLVAILAHELADTDGLKSLTLIHPSAAMSFIAGAVAARCDGVIVDARRSLYDDGEDEPGMDATASKTMFMMLPRERHDAFVRRAVTEARTRVDRRFALIFDNSKALPDDLADVLFEELLHSGAKEVGLIYSGDGLDVIAASLRLRLPDIVIALASERQSEPKLEP